ncbi:hypothetical protein SO802_019732 [Lithocarpus litseifolius]|uniref:Protein-serine/threonine phosphatase n=1 Tax=Lithocarpus litseifolius TaxID=425828 RepID=A0AAW2CTL5_9ROSI
MKWTNLSASALSFGTTGGLQLKVDMETEQQRQPRLTVESENRGNHNEYRQRFQEHLVVQRSPSPARAMWRQRRHGPGHGAGAGRVLPLGSNRARRSLQPTRRVICRRRQRRRSVLGSARWHVRKKEEEEGHFGDSKGGSGNANEDDSEARTEPDNVQWVLGKAGEDRVNVVVSEEQGWLFVGIYDGFNGPDAPEFLMGKRTTTLDD